MLYIANGRDYFCRFSHQKSCAHLFKKKHFHFFFGQDNLYLQSQIIPYYIKLAELFYLSTQPSVFPDIQGWLVAGNVIISINSANALMIVNMY